jgi:hypothetical protein
MITEIAGVRSLILHRLPVLWASGLSSCSLGSGLSSCAACGSGGIGLHDLDSAIELGVLSLTIMTSTVI